MPPPPATARLRFHRWADEHYPLAEALWGDAEVTRYFGGAMTPAQARARMDAEREREQRMGITYWPMTLIETGEFAGCCGLRPWQWDANVIEAGVHLARTAWGKRLGEEALRAVLAYAFDELRQPKIVAGHGLGHANSQALLERVGFRYTHSGLWGPQKIEVLLYALGADAWRAGAGAGA